MDESNKGEECFILNLQCIYKCSMCKGIGYIELWAEKKIKNKFINRLNKLFRTSSCDNCLGTGIDFNKMSNFILSKSMW